MANGEALFVTRAVRRIGSPGIVPDASPSCFSASSSSNRLTISLAITSITTTRHWQIPAFGDLRSLAGADFFWIGSDLVKNSALQCCRFADEFWQDRGMKTRSTWTGHLRVSLLTIPVRLYCALNEADKISFNQLHKGCHQRLKQLLICPVHGKVEREAVVKGYELEKDRFVVMETTEIESLKLETNHTIDLVQFVGENDLDQLLLETPYFLGPDGPVAEEAFSVFREALKRSGRVGIGRVVMAGRERIIALSPLGKGILLTTLRYPAEVRQAAA